MIYQGLDLTLLRDHEVLFFIRIRGKKSYFQNVYTKAFIDLFESINTHRCISEYIYDADVHIDLNTLERDFLTLEEHAILSSIIDYNDVIMRCRGLRTTKYTTAVQLINRAFLFFYRLYSENKELRLIACGAVDNYIMDIMQRTGSYCGIKFIGITDSFMSPKYKLITLRGEASSFSTPAEEEVLKVYEKLKETMVSPIVPNKRKAKINAVYDFCSYYYRYFIRYILTHKFQGKLAYEYMFAPVMGKFNSFDKLLAVKYLKAEHYIIIEAGKRYAYIPLHYFPEATIDYWITDPYHVNYETSLIDTIEKLTAQGFEIIVKEHPAFYLARSSSFYKKIVERGCFLVSPFVLTKNILAKVDLVVVWNGSTGIEAIVNQKPVVKVTNSYYGDGIIPGLDQAAELPKPTDEIGLNVIKKVLESSFRTVGLQTICCALSR